MTIRHVVGLSGGKDSTALALRLAELNPDVDYEYICNETGDELPEMVEHWRKLEELLGKPLIRVRYKLDLYGTIEEIGMVPNVFQRWCTRILKIEPTLDYFDSLPADSILYVGLRADEEERVGLYGDDVTCSFPMRDWGWTEADVWAYLQERGVTIPERTDCALCPYQRLGEWRALYFNYPLRYAQGIAIEEKYGHTFRSDGRDTWPAALKDLAVEFDNGRKLRNFKNPKRCQVCK